MRGSGNCDCDGGVGGCGFGGVAVGGVGVGDGY